MLGVMRILAEASKGGKQPEFMSSHPHPETRIETIKKFLEEHKDELSKLTLTKGKSLR
jgi:predicted Zn-dependent protease